MLELDAGAGVDLEQRARVRIGDVLRNKYRLEDVLGVGGMAAVYAATHRNGRRVAVKMLHAEYTLQTEVLRHFLREGYAANQVQHPGAVSVLDDDVAEDGVAFLVMELLEGRTVQSLWESDGPQLEPPIVLSILDQLLDVVIAAHANGVIHRDLKPENLFLTREGQLKVLDFGVARMRDISARTTQNGGVFGTPAFMAPEQALGQRKEIDETTDLWAVGAIAFALLAGEIVHPGETVQQTLVHAATRPARRLGPLAPHVPERIVAVIERSLAFSKADRWPTALDMRIALASAARESYGAPPAPPGSLGRLSGDGTPLPSTMPTLEAPALSARTLPARTRSWSFDRAGLALAGVFLACLVLASSAGLTAERVSRSSAAQAPSVSHDVGSLQPAAVASDGTGEEAPEAAPEEPPVEAATSPVGLAAPAPSVGVGATPSPIPSAVASLSPSGGLSSGAPPARVAAPSRATTLGCNPPFVIDLATGRKKWKVECL